MALLGFTWFYVYMPLSGFVWFQLDVLGFIWNFFMALCRLCVLKVQVGFRASSFTAIPWGSSASIGGYGCKSLFQGAGLGVCGVPSPASLGFKVRGLQRIKYGRGLNNQNGVWGYIILSL